MPKATPASSIALVACSELEGAAADVEVTEVSFVNPEPSTETIPCDVSDSVVSATSES
jgi:hypothetical protein